MVHAEKGQIRDVLNLGYRGRTQLLNLILAWGYVIRIACRENHESMLREPCTILLLSVDRCNPSANQ